nr:MAG TPA: hypothetical protein [Caudoviricetes sp.]
MFFCIFRFFHFSFFIRQRLKPEKACCTGFLYTTRQLNKRILATHKYNIAIV